MYVCAELLKSCVNVWTVTHQALLSMGFSRQEHWSGFPCPSPGDRPHPGIKHESPALIKHESPALQADSLLLKLLGKPHHCQYIWTCIWLCVS